MLKKVFNPNCNSKLVQKCEGIFYQVDEKNRCIVGATELFFEEVLMKKTEQIGLIWSYNWDKQVINVISLVIMAKYLLYQ